MPSSINPDWPVEGLEATTQSIRDNFEAAKDEIEELQADAADLRRTVEDFEAGGSGIGARVIIVPRGNGYGMYANNFVGYMKIEIIGDCQIWIGPSSFGGQHSVYSLHQTIMIENLSGSPQPGWAFCWEQKTGWDRLRDTTLYIEAVHPNYSSSAYRSSSPVYIACWPLPGYTGSSS